MATPLILLEEKISIGNTNIVGDLGLKKLTVAAK